MVGLAGDDREGPEELLEQDHPRQLVRECHRTEGDPMVGVGKLDAVRSSDHEAEGPGFDLALPDEAGEPR